MVKEMVVNFKHLSKTAPARYPVDDGRGNAEAFEKRKGHAFS